MTEIAEWSWPLALVVERTVVSGTAIGRHLVQEGISRDAAVAVTAGEALRILSDSAPGLLVMTFSVSQWGVPFIVQARQTVPGISIVALLEQQHLRAAPALLGLGVALVGARQPLEAIVGAASAVSTGGLHVPTELLASLSSSAGKLSGHEREVLELLAAGATNCDIAHSLCLSIKAVEARVSQLLAHLGALTRADAVERAWQFGLLDCSGPGQPMLARRRVPVPAWSTGTPIALVR